jgi:hypothetical protein
VGASIIGWHTDGLIVHSETNSPDISKAKSAIEPDRAWTVVAGPELTPQQLLRATVPDGPGGRWDGGEYQRIEVKNAVALKARAVS